jgi:hypothetical protein
MEASQQTIPALSEDASHRALRPVGDRYAHEVLSLDDGSGIRRLALMLDTVIPRLTSQEQSDRAGP